MDHTAKPMKYRDQFGVVASVIEGVDYDTIVVLDLNSLLEIVVMDGADRGFEPNMLVQLSVSPDGSGELEQISFSSLPEICQERIQKARPGQVTGIIMPADEVHKSKVKFAA